jgi:hypothetical protein
MVSTKLFFKKAYIYGNRQTHSDWNMVYILVVFMLINPRTRDGVLLLLYYAQDSVIQIDINNTSIPHTYDDQA